MTPCRRDRSRLHRGRLSRRAVLRGCGAAVALPLLEAMQSARSSAAVVQPHQRAAFFYVPNGVVQSAWHPPTVGRGFALSPTLEPLARVREKISVFSGLDRVKVPGTDGHAQASTCWLSSAAPDELSPAGYPLKRTLDQIIAEETGKSTPFRSLELSCNPYQDNKESVYFDNISWYGHGHVARSMRDPLQVFQRLFAVQPAAAGANVLDLVLDDARALRPQLGQLDRHKLDEYLESVRVVEKQVARLQDRRGSIEALRLRPPTTPWTELRRDEHIQLMGDLMILALRTDLTRVASLMVAPERWGSPQIIDGLFDGPIVHHSMSHEQRRPVVRKDLMKLDRFHVEQFARIAAKMDSIAEGEGTLLDSMLFAFGSGLSSGARHVYSDLPLVVAGSAGGRVKTDRHARFPAGTPVANLWLAMAKTMGVAIDRFADSTGVLPLG